MLWAGFMLQTNNIYVLKQYKKGNKEHNLIRTEPARNPLPETENTPKSYFATLRTCI